MLNVPWPNTTQDRRKRLAEVLAPFWADREALIRFVVSSAPDGTVRSLFGRIDIVRVGEDSLSLPHSQKLGHVEVLSERLAASVFHDRFLAAMSGSPLNVAGVSVADHGIDLNWDACRRTTADYRERDWGLPWPCLDFYTDRFPHRPADPRGPIYGSDGGYYSDYDDLLSKVSGLRPYYGHSDGRRDRLTLLVWDYRGRLVSAVRKESDIAIRIEGQSLDTLSVVGKVKVKDGPEVPFVEPAAQEVVLTRIGQGKEVECSLVRHDDQIDQAWLDVEDQPLVGAGTAALSPFSASGVGYVSLPGTQPPEGSGPREVPTRGPERDKKLQVFVSSTYEDLRREREALTWAILSVRHIPAGMENFNAHPDRGWKVIRETIDDSDVYVLVIGGRYGSMDPATGRSWTEKEYDYAVQRNLPVLAFVRDMAQARVKPGKSQEGRAARRKLASFRKKVRDAHLAPTWTTKDDLAQKVIAALYGLVRERDGVLAGWVRGSI